jgi:2-polyprenyl-3-methyl-5-hydroxy-6-metoxy-1,4-benzoquinol methylase
MAAAVFHCRRVEFRQMKDYKKVVAERYDVEQDTNNSIYAPTHPIGKYTREVLFGGMRDFIGWYTAARGDAGEKRLLDVGCGGGEMVAFFTGNGFKPELSTGVDLSETRIKRARQLLPDATFVCDDGVDFKLSQRFDLITTFDLLSHLPTKDELLRALTNIHLHLESDGFLLWYDIYSEDHFASPENADSWGFSRQQMTDLAQEAGFEPVFYRSFFKLIFNRYHSAYQVRRFPKFVVKLMEKVLPGVPGNGMLVLRKR